MRILCIDEQAKERIKKVIEYAQAHCLTLEQLKSVPIRDITPVGMNPEHVVELVEGYRVVYSHEMQPFGRCAHASISISGGKLPNPYACKSILEEFGFKITDLDFKKDITAWIEEVDENTRAMNFLQLLQKKPH